MKGPRMGWAHYLLYDDHIGPLEWKLRGDTAPRGFNHPRSIRVLDRVI